MTTRALAHQEACEGVVQQGKGAADGGVGLEVGSAPDGRGLMVCPRFGDW